MSHCHKTIRVKVFKQSFLLPGYERAVTCHWRSVKRMINHPLNVFLSCRQQDVSTRHRWRSRRLWVGDGSREEEAMGLQLGRHHQETIHQHHHRLSEGTAPRPRTGACRRGEDCIINEMNFSLTDQNKLLKWITLTDSIVTLSPNHKISSQLC